MKFKHLFYPLLSVAFLSCSFEDTNTEKGNSNNNETPGSGNKTNPGEKPNPEEKPKPNPEEKPKPNPGEKPKPNPGEKPKPNPGEKPVIPEPKIHLDGKIVRIMAANITSGKDQAYEEPGIRIFRSFKPDIVLIQEFNYDGKNSNPQAVSAFVSNTFGSEYRYVRGKHEIPNGIVSRYPILSSGAWPTNVSGARPWDWAVIDIPGERNLLAVSVHLHSKNNGKELAPLAAKIREKINADNENYYVVLGGDFNTDHREPVLGAMKSIFDVSSPFPSDQCGNDSTNRNRYKTNKKNPNAKSNGKPYDWLLSDPELSEREVQVVLKNCKTQDVVKRLSCPNNGDVRYACAFPNGLVFDSTIFEPLDTLGVYKEDSRESNMQHMPVIRDFAIPE